MYRKLNLFILIISLFAFAGCSAGPEKTVNAFFTDLNNAKLAELNQYIDSPLFEGVIEEAELELLGVYFNTLSVSTPKELSKSSTEAAYDVTITAVDLSTVVQTVLAEVIAAQSSEEGEMLTDEELDAKVLAAIAAADAPKKRVAIQINLMKMDGKWKIIMDDVLRAGIFVQEPMTGDEFSYEAYEFRVVDSKTAKVTYTGEIIEGVCAFVEGELEVYAECDPSQVESLEATKGQEIEITYDVLSDIEDAGEGNETEYYSLTTIK